jgi:hypothetical protein
MPLFTTFNHKKLESEDVTLRSSPLTLRGGVGELVDLNHTSRFLLASLTEAASKEYSRGIVGGIGTTVNRYFERFISFEGGETVELCKMSKSLSTSSSKQSRAVGGFDLSESVEINLSFPILGNSNVPTYSRASGNFTSNFTLTITRGSGNRLCALWVTIGDGGNVQSSGPTTGTIAVSVNAPMIVMAVNFTDGNVQNASGSYAIFNKV